MWYSPLIFLWAFHLLTWLVSRYTAHWTKAYTYNEHLCCFVLYFPEMYDFDRFLLWFLWLWSSQFSSVHVTLREWVNCSHFVKAEHRLQLRIILLLPHLLHLFTSLPPQMRGSFLPPVPSSSTSLFFLIPRVPPTLSSQAWHYLSLFPPLSFLYHRSVLWMHSVAPSMKAWKNQIPDRPSTTSWHSLSLG